MRRAPLLERHPRVVHGFTDRCDGDLARPSGADLARIAAAAGMAGAPVARLDQVHGARVLEVVEGGIVGEGDALVARRPGLLVAVRTADCVPVLLVGDGAVAAVHAGWRGVAAGVVPAAVHALGGAALAAVGPAICGRCYAVGEEVVGRIAATGVPVEAFARARGDRWHADLRAAVRWQLARAGVPAVESVPGCTLEDPDLFSHRGGDAGRQLAFVGLRE